MISPLNRVFTKSIVC